MSPAPTRLMPLAILSLLGACATPGPILTDDIGAIRSGVTATQEQARISFDAANKLALDEGIEYKIASPERTLKLCELMPVPAPEPPPPCDLPTPVSAADAAAWSNAFGILDAYGAALQSLVAPGRSEATGDALSGLATSLNGPTVNAKIPAALSAVFATFGQALVQAKAEKSATAVMRKTDPAFGQVLSAMADAIGASPREGLQLTVDSNWRNSVFARLETSYDGLAPGDPARRQVLKDYTTAVAARSAQLASLSQLHQSLLALAEAHAAAARGHPGDALFWIGRINGWLDDIQRRADAAPSNGGGQ